MEPVHPLRAHRHSHGWSMDDVAERLIRLGREEGVRGLATSGTTVGRWERGQCQPRHPYPRLLSILFEASAVELGLAPSPYASPSDTLDDVERRRLLRLLGGAIAAPVVARGKAGADAAARILEADRLAHALSRPSKADEAAASLVEASIANARRLDDISGPRVAVEPALVQQRVIQALLKGGPSAAVANRLTVAAGELSQFLAHLAHEMNDHPTSRGYLEAALGIAHETDSHNMAAYVLGWRSRLEMAESQPQQALAWAESAKSLGDAKGSPATRSWLAGREADARARLGDRKGAERALDRARTAFARSRAGDEPCWMYHYQESSLDYRLGSVYMALGLAEPARRALEQSIATIDPSKVRDRAFSLASLAETYVVDAEVDEVCRLASEALTIATATRCDRAVPRVHRLRAQLKPWESEAMVRNLDDHLAATSAWCRQAIA